ncbi:hypothetical protein ACLMJK_003817 [Lecanora helva]
MVEQFTRANTFIVNKIDEALDPSEKDHEVAVNGVDADTNREIFQEQEVPVIKDIGDSATAKPELHEPTRNPSPLREDDGIRTDDPWSAKGFKALKPKKGKKMAKLGNGGPVLDDWAV